MVFSVNSIKAFCKASGVKSILQTKPQCLGKINPAKLNSALPKSDTINIKKTLQGMYHLSYYSKWEPMTLSPRFETRYVNTRHALDKSAINEYYGKPCIYIDKIVSGEPGYGTNAIKHIVRESLKEANGHVTLSAELIDTKKGHPLGFYYKMGFRPFKQEYSKICEQWIKNGGKGPIQELSHIDCVKMYLPKDNIKHCLEYPEKFFILA